ncbi:hypothetical protein CDAR_573181 [Caerostris darwini]|uniref:Uncharacterized protein n=1 Tax=Caerostris darwini TaxID=1538125 RepID=A0AAV4W6X8_9ARAC|nr:hypothetical protein CDAR_573181 [Caerostris darwini]
MVLHKRSSWLEDNFRKQRRAPNRNALSLLAGNVWSGKNADRSNRKRNNLRRGSEVNWLLPKRLRAMGEDPISSEKKIDLFVDFEISQAFLL